jgi:hypothetical protein
MCFGGSRASNRGSVSSSRSSSGSRSTPTRRRSAGRGSGANRNLRQTVQGVTRNITTDLRMGLSTFGMSKERQAEKLSEMGYSPRAIDSYQARTAASRERMRQESMRSDYGNDDSPAPAPVSAPAPAPAPAPTTTTPTPTPPPAPAPISDDTSAPEEGSAEEAVVEGAENRRGRASTIGTSAQGLLTTARTRRRRSLMGGEEPRGLIS